MAVSEVAAKILYAEGSKGILCALIVQVKDNSTQIEDDVFNALHEPKLLIWPNLFLLTADPANFLPP